VDEAMREAVRMVEAYVRAGFPKIHLDASMACADDPSPLSDETIAQRTAQLCAAAEKARGAEKLFYVIGTEVPIPGGATESLSGLEVTRKEAVQKTLAVHREAFEKAGLASVWPRVIALVVQPGVEFNHDAVVDYDPSRAADLTEVLHHEKGLVYEAHSTDYQQPEAYKNLVRDGFSILKVGPALTFAMRQALDALSEIEAELVAPGQRAQLPEVLEFIMRDDKRYWGQHYGGNEQTVHLLRRFSYSDRVRYYWNDPRIVGAVARLSANFEGIRIPETLLSAFMPEQYHAVRAGKLLPEAHAVLLDSIRTVLRPYAAACNL
jgi:D-tagatose-1,6-bisphosphate aldolase subunit GatZ/KbaZ